MDATVETPTPVTAPDTSSTVPATTEPTPVSTPATGGRPQSAKDLAQVMERMDQAAGLASPDAATIPPADPTAQAVPPPPAGPIPLDVHTKALENARIKSATEAVAQRDQQWQKEAGWIFQQPAERRAAIPELVRDFYANPAMFIANVYGQLQNHPQWGPQLRSLMGGNGNGNGHAPVSDEPQPDVQIMNEHGQAVSMGYSAARQIEREAWLKKQYFAEIDQRIAPLREDRDRRVAEQQSAEANRQINTQADQIMGRITGILDGRQDLFTHVDARVASGMDAIDAALAVRQQYIVPQQAQQATVAAADTMRRKAVAGSTANGGGSTTTPIGRPKNHKELAALLESLDSRG